jgi:hypothetical protein
MTLRTASETDLRISPSYHLPPTVSAQGARKGVCLVVGLACAGSLVLWQALTVHYRYGGNWTALFCIGDQFKIPAPLQSEGLYVFQGSTGYDGEFYHELAHDPLLRKGFNAGFDSPSYRSQRILVPALAFLLALGRDRAIDAAYISVVAIFVVLGAYWLARLSVSFNGPAWIGLSFALVPAVLVSADRMTVDVALAALCVGFQLYVGERADLKLYLVLALAPLVRETGLLLLGAYVIYLITWRRLRAAAMFSTAAVPIAGWLLWVRLHSPRGKSPGISIVPFYGLADRIVHVHYYAGSEIHRYLYLAIGLDFLALSGIVAGLAWVFYLAYRRVWTSASICAYLFAILAASFPPGDLWGGPYAYGRTLTPLLLLPALEGINGRSVVPVLAMLAIDLPVGHQMFIEVLNGVLGRSH